MNDILNYIVILASFIACFFVFVQIKDKDVRLAVLAVMSYLILLGAVYVI
jgi:hypothetical protein